MPAECPCGATAKLGTARPLAAAAERETICERLKPWNGPNKILLVTTLAERIISDFRTLDPAEQLIVRAHVVAATQSEQRKTIQRLRGSGKGERLLEKLLKDRAEERARG